MTEIEPRRDRRGGNQHTGLKLAEALATMDAIRMIPLEERSEAQQALLLKLDRIHYQRMLRLPKTIARLEKKLAELRALQA